MVLTSDIFVDWNRTKTTIMDFRFVKEKNICFKVEAK